MAAFTAWALWSRRPIGYLLSSVFVVKGVAMSWAICAMVLSAWASEGNLDVGALLLFVGIGAAASVLAIKVFAGLADDVTTTTAAKVEAAANQPG